MHNTYIPSIFSVLLQLKSKLLAKVPGFNVILSKKTSTVTYCY